MVGHLNREVQTGSDVIRENSVGNSSLERRTLNQKSLIGVISPQHCGEENTRYGMYTRRNIAAMLPLFNEFKQKHVQGGAHGPHRAMTDGSNIGRWGPESWVGHLGPPAQTGSGRSLGGKPGKPTHGEDNSQSKIIYWSFSPQHWSYLAHGIGVKPDAIKSCPPCHRQCPS